MRIPPTGVILAAAGEGRRLGSPLPKAFVPLAGLPLFLHSLRTFASLPFVREIVLVLPANHVKRLWKEYGRRLAALKVSMVIAGGARRQDSVRLGLAATTLPIILVHDAARPLVTHASIRAVALAAARHGAAVLAAPAVDTIKIADSHGRILTTPDRRRVWHAQTPQGFRREVLLAGYLVDSRSEATDDAQLVERSGAEVVIVPGDGGNFKITTKEELLRAGNFLDRFQRKRILAPDSRN
jgi:2-C-methyl-D-erythritol 4-phosphate cytidylyltransferase